MPPTFEPTLFHYHGMNYIEDHLPAGEVSDHRIEQRFHFRFAQVVQHPLGDKQPGPIPWNLVQPAQIVQRCTDQVIGRDAASRSGNSWRRRSITSG